MATKKSSRSSWKRATAKQSSKILFRLIQTGKRHQKSSRQSSAHSWASSSAKGRMRSQNWKVCRDGRRNWIWCSQIRLQFSSLIFGQFASRTFHDGADIHRNEEGSHRSSKIINSYDDNGNVSEHFYIKTARFKKWDAPKNRAFESLSSTNSQSRYERCLLTLSSTTRSSKIRSCLPYFLHSLLPLQAGSSSF